MSERTTLTIEGMTCGHCKATVEEALRGVAGVRTVQVDLEGGAAQVEGGDVDALVAAVAEEGYQARPAS